jgi:hypothetical protein
MAMMADTLVAVPHRRAAEHAGGRHLGKPMLYHHADNSIRFWWPELGTEILHGREWGTVIVDSAVRLSAKEHDLLSAMNRRHDGFNSVWIEP